MYKCAKKPVPFHPTKHYKFAQGYKVNFILSRMDIKIFRKTSKYAIHINLKKKQPNRFRQISIFCVF